MNEARLARPAACDGADTRIATAQWLRNGLRVGLRVAIITGVIGLAISGFDPTYSGFVENLVYSECIGLCIFVLISGLRRRFPPKHPGFTPLLIHGLIAVPVGLFVGLNIGALLFGNPTGLGVFNHAAIFAFPITIAVSAGTMYFLWSRKRLAEVATGHAQAERLVAEAQLRMLQAQIEPHMLFNTLANLRTLVGVEPQRAQTMIDQLIVYLRGTLSASRSTTTTLAGEFAQLEAYLELMKVRMGPRLAFSLDLPAPLRDCAVPPMLLQPLVENAIRHGLEPKIAGGTIRIAASSSGSTLTIAVEDDGIGLTDTGDEPGYGIVHVRERLRTLHGDVAHLAIESSSNGGVRACVEMPR